MSGEVKVTNDANDRFAMWMSHLTSDHQKETSGEHFSRIVEEIESEPSPTGRSSGHPGEIMRDVVRTFPTHPFFRPGMRGEKMLTRVLLTVARERPDVGYCQGMNFVVGTLIFAQLPQDVIDARDIVDMDNKGNYEQEQILSSSNSPLRLSQPGVDPWNAAAAPCSDEQRRAWDRYEADFYRAEENSFNFMMELIDTKGRLGMAGLWQASVPRLKLRVYQFDRIMKWQLPNLHAHLQEIELAPEIFVAQWFVTLYSYTLPVALTMRIWDYIFLKGWPAMFRVAMSLLQELQGNMLLMDLEQVSGMMRGWKRSDDNGSKAFISTNDEIIQRACNLEAYINEEVLLRLQQDYALEMISLSEEQGDRDKERDRERDKGLLDYSSGAGTFALFSVNQSFSGKPPSSFPVSPVTSPRNGTMLGFGHSVDSPNWLQRYGDAVNPDDAEEMIKLKDELMVMEAQIEQDKQSIQTKIIRASDLWRKALLELDEAQKEKDRCFEDVSHLEVEFESMLLLAQTQQQQLQLGHEPSRKVSSNAGNREAPLLSSASCPTFTAHRPLSSDSTIDTSSTFPSFRSNSRGQLHEQVGEQIGQSSRRHERFRVCDAGIQSDSLGPSCAAAAMPIATLDEDAWVAAVQQEIDEESSSGSGSSGSDCETGYHSQDRSGGGGGGGGGNSVFAPGRRELSNSSIARLTTTIHDRNHTSPHNVRYRSQFHAGLPSISNIEDHFQSARRRTRVRNMSQYLEDNRQVDDEEEADPGAARTGAGTNTGMSAARLFGFRLFPSLMRRSSSDNCARGKTENSGSAIDPVAKSVYTSSAAGMKTAPPHTLLIPHGTGTTMLAQETARASTAPVIHGSLKAQSVDSALVNQDNGVGLTRKEVPRKGNGKMTSLLKASPWVTGLGCRDAAEAAELLNGAERNRNPVTATVSAKNLVGAEELASEPTRSRPDLTTNASPTSIATTACTTAAVEAVAESSRPLTTLNIPTICGVDGGSEEVITMMFLKNGGCQSDVKLGDSDVARLIAEVMAGDSNRLNGSNDKDKNKNRDALAMSGEGGDLLPVSTTSEQIHIQIEPELIHASNIPSDAETSNANTGGTVVEEASSTMRLLLAENQKCQQRLIDIKRSLDNARSALALAIQRLQAAKVAEEEAREWKASLCEQLQRLVEGVHKGRSEKLRTLTETFIV